MSASLVISFLLSWESAEPGLYAGNGFTHATSKWAESGKRKRTQMKGNDERKTEINELDVAQTNKRLLRGEEKVARWNSAERSGGKETRCVLMLK